MEVLVGSTLGIEVSSASAFVRERAAAAAASSQVGDDSEMGFGPGRSAKSEEDDSSSDKSSSIGAPDDSDEEEDEDGVVSSEDAKGGLRKGGFGSFGSLASLEDSLPIKRGLSNHFSGKSKSFSNLSEANLTEVASSAKDLEKPEHPFNKKRRILRWSKNFSILSPAKSMPLFPLSEEDDFDDDAAHAPHRRVADDDDDAHDGERGKAAAASRFAGRHGRKHSVFKSSSCFALSDLHEEDEEEDEEDEGEGGN